MRIKQIKLGRDRIDAITNDPEQIYFPPPKEGSLFKWGSELDNEQLLAASVIYTDRWTWDNGDPFNKKVLKALEEEIVNRGGLEPDPGDFLYSTIDQRQYFYTGTEWVPFEAKKVTTKVGDDYGAPYLESYNEDG